MNPITKSLKGLLKDIKTGKVIQNNRITRMVRNEDGTITQIVFEKGKVASKKTFENKTV